MQIIFINLFVIFYNISTDSASLFWWQSTYRVFFLLLDNPWGPMAVQMTFCLWEQAISLPRVHSCSSDIHYQSLLCVCVCFVSYLSHQSALDLDWFMIMTWFIEMTYLSHSSALSSNRRWIAPPAEVTELSPIGTEPTAVQKMNSTWVKHKTTSINLP